MSEVVYKDRPNATEHSEMLSAKKLLSYLIITIYHGNKMEDLIPEFGLGSSDNDYGKGFYTTPGIELAREWAWGTYTSDTFVRKDTKENFYHGILLGILGFKNDWYVSSNRESKFGFSDIQIEIENEKTGIVIEVKCAHGEDMEALCMEALGQIEERGYADRLYEDGMQTVLKYGIACYRKECRVRLASDRNGRGQL